MARKMVQMDDDRGAYSFPLGAEAVPLAQALPDIEHDFEHLWDDNDVLEITLETLLGWDRWRWALHVGPATYFLDGDTPPTADELPFGEPLEPEAVL